jgi:hypothetical protein
LCGIIDKWHYVHIEQRCLLSFQLNPVLDSIRKFVDLSLTLWFIVWLIGYTLHFSAEMLAGVAW